MPRIKIMTFNVENMLARFDFREWEKERLATLPDIDSDVDRSNLIRTHWNVINEENRVATSLNIRLGDPDVICLQEIENMHSLRSYHDRYLRRIYREFDYKMLIEGNDRRGIDVAMLSSHKIENVRTHQHLKREINYPTGKRLEKVFRRDCLEVNVKKDNKILPIFICHFKSMAGGRKATKPIREAEAGAVKDILEERFGDPSNHDWIIVGDLNDFTETDGVADNDHGLFPLLDNNFSFNIIKNIQDPINRWTHFYSGDNTYHQLDYILMSPLLHDKNPGIVPVIIRDGQPFRSERYKGNRWARIGYDRPKASDHCPVVAEINY